MDEPALGTTRPTDDVDVIIEILAQKNYARIEERLRKLGFQNDDSEGAPMCRWIFREQLTVDIMPTTGTFLGLSTKLFSEALETSQVHYFDDVEVRVILVLLCSYLSWRTSHQAPFSFWGARHFQNASHPDHATFSTAC